jgi:hypothetical protein
MVYAAVSYTGGQEVWRVCWICDCGMFAHLQLTWRTHENQPHKGKDDLEDQEVKRSGSHIDLVAAYTQRSSTRTRTSCESFTLLRLPNLMDKRLNTSLTFAQSSPGILRTHIKLSEHQCEEVAILPA